LIACAMIVLYITYSFRRVPKPAASFRFGVTAIIALIHDVLVVVGMFAIFGKLFNIEIDTLFVTALLTVIGFSVHDTIVVFDRIRENLPKHLSKKFTEIADISITQTLGRSLNTSLTVFFVLLALLLFGGVTIKWFVAALLIGIVSGTYSSIFNATALLCLWEEKLGH
ncbi:MAG: protein translocase subunit SecF, partial [Candidatus Paceibacterales bacterium]